MTAAPSATKDTGLIHSVVTDAATVHDLTPAAELLHDDEAVVYADVGCQGIMKRAAMDGKTTEFRVAMCPAKNARWEAAGSD